MGVAPGDDFQGYCGHNRGVFSTNVRRFTRSVELPGGDLDAYADQLFRWEVHRRAGLDISATDSPLALNTVVNMTLRLGPLRIPASCRVSEIWDEPDRRGFSYQTLPGHPEEGVETFLLTRPSEGHPVTFAISATSRPATWLARLAGPLGRAVQTHITNRYLDALQ